MKKIFLVALVALTACAGQNGMKKALEAYVTERASGFDDSKVDYELESYTVLDTLTNKDMLDSLESKLRQEGMVWYEPTKDSLLKIKETRFPDYFMNDADSYAEVKKHWDVIDSLVARWDEVTPFSYELNYEPLWFTLARCTIYEVEPGEWFSEHFNGTVENKSNYRMADSLSKTKPDEVYAYKVRHNYSIFNPLVDKRVDIKELVMLDKNLKLISCEVENSMEDVLEQLSK